MFVYVGCYTSADRNGRGQGITVFHAETPGIPWRHVQTLPTLDNPSLLRMAPEGRALYAVHGGRTQVSAYAIDPVDGKICAHGNQGTGGVNPVDLAILPSGFLVIANYTSGTVTLLRVDRDGALLDFGQTIVLARPGYGAGDCAAVMPHGVAVDVSARFVLIPAKGFDCVFVLRFDPSGRLVPAALPYAACADGSGPRHAVFHPVLPVLYVVGEMGCSVQVFHWNAETGELRAMQSVSTLPPGGAAASTGAEIAISSNGRSLYASNRGHDSIAHFAVDPSTGSLGPAHCTPSQGHEPRLFVLAPDGRTLHVANQESDCIVSFPLDAAGQLGAGTVSARVGSPSSICFGGAP